MGGSRVIPTDVRIIAATNRDLAGAIASGTFRADLFYRLNVFPIRVPPLRNREEDIPMLVEYLVKRYAEKARKQISAIDKDTLKLCQSYPWPGNIRELQNIIERSVILCTGDTFWIDVEFSSALGRLAGRHTCNLTQSKENGMTNHVRPYEPLTSQNAAFPWSTLAIALVSATTLPIRADQARSTQGQSNTSTSKAGRTTQKTSLRWDVFLAPSIPAITSDLPPGEKQRPWPPISSTLISGERDAVLVDTPITVEQARALANWVVASGKNLTTIYASHGHGDHFFGTSTVLERFPNARFVARPEVIQIMRQQASPESLATFWNPRFPDQISSHLAIAEDLTGNVIDLEGHDLVSVPLGFTDTANTTCLHVPAIGLIVAGDAAYNGVHLHLSESPDQQKRQQWIAALDKMESLKPRAVIAGHKRVGNDDSPKILSETRRYIKAPLVRTLGSASASARSKTC